METAVKDVSKFEANLIRILRCFLGQSPIEQSLSIILGPEPRPKCLSRACVELVKDSLAKGVPLFLARHGWRTERYIRDESVVEGRLWQRTQLEQLRLDYSQQAMEWLIWVTAECPAQPKSWPNSTRKDASDDDIVARFELDGSTTGDSLLFLLSFSNLRDTQAVQTLIRLPSFNCNPLIGLLFPDAFTGEQFVGTPDFAAWFQPDRVWVLEALQPWLCERWLDLEKTKRRLQSNERLRSIGNAQQLILEAFLEEAHKAGRHDLARFVMDVAVLLLRNTAGQTQQNWFPQVDVGELRMADRQNIYEAGLVLLRNLDRLNKWNQAARTVGFYDEEYETSQLWKSDWERWDGDTICARANEVVDAMAEFNVG